MFRNRVTEMLGVEIPVVQAPMGWIARSQLAAAVSNAGAMGIIETSSGELDVIREEIKKMRSLTDKPFGVNIAQAFVRDPNIVQFVVDQIVKHQPYAWRDVAVCHLLIVVADPAMITRDKIMEDFTCLFKAHLWLLILLPRG